MKKFGILVASALVMGMSFTSCSSDDDSNNIGSVVGKWEFNTYKYYLNGQFVSEEAYDDHEPNCAKDYLEIRENGTAKSVDYFGSDCTEFSDESTYTRNGNTITINDGDSTETVQVLTANSSTLVLRYTDTYEGVTAATDVSFTKAQ
jgi:hypothetical protein